VAAAVAALLSVQLLAAGAAPANTHQPATTTSGPFGGARALVAKDLDGDGDKDLATAGQNTGMVRVLRNNGSGTFFPVFSTTLVPGLVGIVAGHFNSDARWDLAVTNSYANTVTIRYGTGNGLAFVPGPIYTVGANASPRQLAVGRFNADSRDDLAIANGNSNDVRVLLGSSSGAFTPSGSFTIVPAGSTEFQPHGIAIGDFNGDLRQDVATANYEPTGKVSILLGTGTGAFGAPQAFAAGPFPIDVAAADLINSDGRLDLIVANFTTAGTVSALRGLGNGSFVAPITSPIPTANLLDKPAALVVDNFGHGTARDLAVAMGGPAGAAVAVMCGNNSGAFALCMSTGHVRAVGGFPFDVVSANFNGIVGKDIATANLNGDSVSLIRSP